MKLYGGIDLHSTNNYHVLIDETGKTVYDKRLPNDIEHVLQELQSFQEIDSLVVESTYNWYWLVDGLMDAGYKLKLANPNAIQQYNGIKQTNDKSDARWLAELNRLDILNQGYIYPKEDRGTRDLMRKRMQLVQQRTTQILSIKNIIERNTSLRLSANTVMKLTKSELKKYLDDETIVLAVNSNVIIMQCLNNQIKEVEK